MTLNRVVFPAPLGPISVQICSGSIAEPQPVERVTPPKRTRTPLMLSSAMVAVHLLAAATSLPHPP